MEINKVYLGDSIESIKSFTDESIDCVVTSPPYYALRDYGTATWIGGDPKCKHYRYRQVCPICGAVREDKQIGLEETPEQYIQRLVELFREIRRCLKKEGTIWVNI